MKSIVSCVLLAVLVAGLCLPFLQTQVPAARPQGIASNDAQGIASNDAQGIAPGIAQSVTESGAQPNAGGRILFVGDSRTIDMFADSDVSLEGEEHDGVLVYARHGHAFDYLQWLTEELAVNETDTLVSWMGANDRGNFPPYGALYNKLLEEGVRLVVCTVGPTASDMAEVWNNEPYDNKYMQQFNTALISWAAANSVPVIDLYGYVSRNVEIDMADGVHYLPRPDPELWGYILEGMEACGVFSGEEQGTS